MAFPILASSCSDSLRGVSIFSNYNDCRNWIKSHSRHNESVSTAMDFHLERLNFTVSLPDTPCVIIFRTHCVSEMRSNTDWCRVLQSTWPKSIYKFRTSQKVNAKSEVVMRKNPEMRSPESTKKSKLLKLATIIQGRKKELLQPSHKISFDRKLSDVRQEFPDNHWRGTVEIQETAKFAG